jgi:hypothetical protein
VDAQTGAEGLYTSGRRFDEEQDPDTDLHSK